MKAYLLYRIRMILLLILCLCVPLAVYGESSRQQEALALKDKNSVVPFEEIENEISRSLVLRTTSGVKGYLTSMRNTTSGIECRNSSPVQLAALDSPDGPPPCGLDNVCNFSVCSNDPDCPVDFPQQESENEPYEPPHNEKGIGGSVWLTTGPDGFEGGHSCDFEKETCHIKVTWSVQPDKYDKWKICWKDWGDTFTNACDVNQKIRKFENNFYVIPNLKEGHHYRIRLEGRKDKNDKWKCLVKARLRNVHLNGTNIGSTVPCLVP